MVGYRGCIELLLRRALLSDIVYIDNAYIDTNEDRDLMALPTMQLLPEISKGTCDASTIMTTVQILQPGVYQIVNFRDSRCVLDLSGFDKSSILGERFV